MVDGRAKVWTESSRRTFVLGALVGLLSLTCWMLAAGSRGAEIANVLALPLTAVSLAISLAALTSRPEADDPATAAAARRRLLQWSVGEQTETLRRMLLEAGKLEPANLRYGRMETVMWRSDGGRRRGSTREIASYYESLDIGRLVVLGEPGAGKTVTLAVLVLALAAREAQATPAEAPVRPVPVRLSLPTFDPGRDAVHVTDLELRRRFEAWVVAQIAVSTGEPAAVVAAMVGAGAVLPVLDGLDEMDASAEPPVRAAATIRALNCQASVVLAPVVVACRRDRYAEYGRLANGPGVKNVLEDAEVILLEPLTVAEVVAYLGRRFPAAPGGRTAHHRWAEVVSAIRADPLGPVAAALRSPLRLFLTVTAYHDAATRPAELLEVDRSLDDHLFARLIPATVLADQARGDLDPVKVERWLSTLARRLELQRRTGLSGTDLDVHAIGGGRSPVLARSAAAVLQMAVVGACLWTVVRLFEDYGQDGFASRTLAVLTVAAVALTGWRSFHPADELRLFSLAHLKDRSGRARFAAQVGLGVVVGVAAWAVAGASAPPFLVVVVGLAFGAGLGLGLGSGQPDAGRAPRHPSQVLRQMRTHHLVTGYSVGLVAGLGLGPVLMVGAATDQAVACGVLIAVAAAVLYTADSPWPAYLAETAILKCTGDLPRDVPAFLDWAHDSGLIRLTSLAVQFRHRELQDWLSRTHAGTHR